MRPVWSDVMTFVSIIAERVQLLNPEELTKLKEDLKEKKRQEREKLKDEMKRIKDEQRQRKNEEKLQVGLEIKMYFIFKMYVRYESAKSSKQTQKGQCIFIMVVFHLVSTNSFF